LGIDITKLIQLLEAKPEYIDVLGRCVVYQKEHSKNWRQFDGITYADIHVEPAQLRKLLVLGVLEEIYSSSRGPNYYRVREIEKIERILQGVVEEVPTDTVTLEIPSDLFSTIIGYEDVKKWVSKALNTDKIIPILFVGVPASAKTLFLLELNRIPGSVYAIGSASSKAGIADIIHKKTPLLLLIDELDKMSTDDMAVLLSLTETGILTEIKYGKTRTGIYNLKVFASANRTDRLSSELLSRFLRFTFKPYNQRTFLKTVIGVLTKRENTSKKLAVYIADKVLNVLKSKDVRDAIKLARLCDTQSEVDELITTVLKYS